MSIINKKIICDICGFEIERKEGESYISIVLESLDYHKRCHNNAETLSYSFIKRFLWDLCHQLNQDKKELTVDNLMWYSNNEVTAPHTRRKEDE